MRTVHEIPCGILLFGALFGVTSWGHACRADEASRPAPATSSVLEKIARKIEPDLRGRPDRLSQYVELFRRELGNDTRLFAFRVDATMTRDARVELRGHVEFAETRQGLAEFLSVLGFDVINRLELLPDADLGDKTLGLLKIPHCLSYDRPSGQRSVVTDCLLGERLYLLREEHGHLLVHSGEGYIGYVHADAIHRVTESTLTDYLAAPNIQVTSDHQAESGVLIPTGARLKWVGTDGSEVTGELPTGEHVTVPRDKCKVHRRPEPKIENLIENARQLIGTPYLWGGKTSAGIDCSGLVQVSFATIDLRLPRDSNQQFLVGQLTATRRNTSGMQRGDTLYFLGTHGKIRHTAIYLGNDRFLQAVTPVVRISSFNADHDDYDPKRHASFVMAKRFLD